MFRQLTFLFLSVPVLFVACNRTDTSETRTQAERNTEAREYDSDNSGRNVRDAGGETKTATDQSNRETDLKITQEIRQAITGDSSMSINARNVKIITSDGVVTLRGPVDDNEERTTIAAKAQGVDGVARVDNQLETLR
jgi:hyperosmotically inducible periplasmic protein